VPQTAPPTAPPTQKSALGGRILGRDGPVVGLEVYLAHSDRGVIFLEKNDGNPRAKTDEQGRFRVEVTKAFWVKTYGKQGIASASYPGRPSGIGIFFERQGKSMRLADANGQPRVLPVEFPENATDLPEFDIERAVDAGGVFAMEQ
jgi:hypothetical protein